jgi:Putative zinc dependent peptidase (DUF5700)
LGDRRIQASTPLGEDAKLHPTNRRKMTSSNQHVVLPGPSIACRFLDGLRHARPAGAKETARIEIHADFSKADAVMAILAKRSASLAITDSDWETLFKTEAYQRLKKREASMHRDFSDADFAQFIRSDALLERRSALVRTASEWKQADLRAAAGRVLLYLPAEATIRTKVFPVIKPLHNSFMLEAGNDPAIFLYLDPAVSPEAFLNTVAHEMHHIGLSSTDHAYEQQLASLGPAAQRAALWMGAFGEGKQCWPPPEARTPTRLPPAPKS